MKKRYLIAFVLILNGSLSFCQTETFYEGINLTYGYSGVWDMIKTKDNNFILLSVSEPGQSLIIKVDTLGKIIWQKDLIRSVDVTSHPVKIIETSDSNLVVVSTMIISSREVISILYLDRMGNILWSKQSNLSNSNNLESITATENGGFVLAAAGCNWVRVVAELSSEGDIIWQKVLPGYGSNQLNNIIRNDDHTFMVTGYSISGSINGLHCYSIDSVGNMLWHTKYEFPVDNCYTSLIKALDGGYTYLCRINTGIPYKYWPMIIHTNQSGEVQWAKSYNHNLDCIPNSLIQLPDSSYIITGNISYPDQRNVQMLNFKIDKSGNFLWGQSFGNILYNSGGYDDLRCSIMVGNSSFFTAGSGENIAFIKQNAETGKFGCSYDTVNFTVANVEIVGITDYYSGFLSYQTLYNDDFISQNSNYHETIYCATNVSSKYLNQNSKLTIFPNPFSDIATVIFTNTINNAQIDIFDLQGQIVRSIKNINGGSFVLQKETLQSGLYLVRLIEPGNKISYNHIIIMD